MNQQVQLAQFTVEDFKTEAGVMKLNDFCRRVYEQMLLLTGTANGVIKPGANIDLEKKYKVINSA